MLQIGAPLTITGGPDPWRTIRAEATGAAVAALDVVADGSRVRLGLPFLDGDRVIDVSIQPGVWIDRIAQAADAAGVPPNTWKDRIRADLITAGINAGWWLAAEMSRQDAVTVAMRAAWPLLRSTPRTEREIPRWAVPLLQGPTVADGARQLLGDRVTRPVTRAIGELLEAEIDWWPLGVATATTGVRGDHLARLIDVADAGGEVVPARCVGQVEGQHRSLLEGLARMGRGRESQGRKRSAGMLLALKRDVMSVEELASGGEVQP